MTKPKDDGLPAELDQFAQQNAGQGLSDNLDDLSRLILTVLHQNSPQVDARGADYIDGAEPGRLWLRGSNEPIRDHVDGLFITQLHLLTEWAADRGGFVARHGDLPDDAQVSSGGSGRLTYVRANRNILEDTRETYWLIEGQLYMLPLKSTGHQFARDLQSFFRAQKHPKTGDKLPPYVHRLRLTSTPRSNSKGKWWGLKFEKIGWASLAECQQAKALSEDVVRGLLPSSSVASISGPKAA